MLNFNYYVPDRFFFTFNFFDHPTFKSECVTYEHKELLLLNFIMLSEQVKRNY